MLRYTLHDVVKTINVTLSIPSPTTVEMRVGHVNILCNMIYKGQLLCPFIPTTHVLLLFPSSIHPDRQGLADTAVEKISSFLNYVREASGLASDGHGGQLHIVDAALCTTSGNVMLVASCPNVEIALALLNACGEESSFDQPAEMRMGTLYVQSYPCEPPPILCAEHDTDMMAAYTRNRYVIPACVLCADRLETSLTGHLDSTPICACASEGQRCACLQTSACIVCQLFAVSQSSTGKQAKCQDCGQSGDPWVCMVCGYVGCSRYQAMHAKDHYIKTQHFFSINLLTQQIWDYHSDEFVHRVVLFVDDVGGNATRIQYPGRDRLAIEDGGDSLFLDVATDKKNIDAKYDSKLSTSHAQYAMLLKTELDAMRAIHEAHSSQQLGGRTSAPSTATTTPNTIALLPSARPPRPTRDDPFASFGLLEGTVRHISSQQREVISTYYSCQHLSHEKFQLEKREKELEAEARALEESLRGVVRANVQAEMKMSASILELESTLEEIDLNVRTQQRLASRLGSDSAARMVVMGTGNQPTKRPGKKR